MRVSSRVQPAARGAARGFCLAGCLLMPALAAAASCTVSATSLALGTYNPASGTPTDASGLVTVTCAANPLALVLGYTVSLSTGGSGSYAARQMSSGANTLAYQLYSNASHTTVWGNGTGGSSVVNGGLLLSLLFPVSANHTVYGRLPALQSAAAAGAYTDVIVVTVAY